MIFFASSGQVFHFEEEENIWTTGDISLEPDKEGWPCLRNSDGDLVKIEGHMIEDHGADNHFNGDYETSYFNASILHFFFTLLYPLLWAMAKIHSKRVDIWLNRSKKNMERGNMKAASKSLEKSLKLMGRIPVKYRNSPEKRHEKALKEKQKEEREKGS